MVLSAINVVAFMKTILAIAMVLIFSLAGTDAIALSVPIAVKEVAGIGATNWPITAVVPLPYGAYSNLAMFVLRDSSGVMVPAQFAVLNRWEGRDHSLRHVSVQFQASVGPYTGAGTGTNVYFLKDDGPGSFSTGLTVSNETDWIIVQTGPLRFTVNKHAFNIVNEAWLDADSNGVFTASERIVNSAANQGAVLVDWQGNIRRDAERTNITVTIEESGPLRAVIKVSSPTHFVATNNHLHGFAARIYAYAGKPWIKVDYQLQNGARNAAISWPLYFDSYRLDFGLAISNTPTLSVGLGTNLDWTGATQAIRLAQTFHNTCVVYDAVSAPLQTGERSDGWLDVYNAGRGVGLFTRNFWTMWPNGLRYTNDGTLTVELFPDWSCQFFATNNTGPKFFTGTHWYWLDDMQATYKELLLHFHAAPLGTSDLHRLAAQFERPPVPVIPLDWYRTTRVTLDLEGFIPEGTPADADLSRQPTFLMEYDFSNSVYYRFGWDNYYLDETIRKFGANTTGGFPDSSGSRFIAVGNPALYYDAERKALAELNVRTHWIAGYTHSNDWDRLRLTQLPYGAESWRRFDGHGTPWLAAAYMDGTALDVHPRDDQHGWFQHVRDWYHLSADPWARDWYEFIGQFRYTTLLRCEAFPDTSGRARGHGLAHALAAYRATGNREILDLMAEEVRRLRGDQYQHGGRQDAGPGLGASWQAGYVSRAVLDYMNEIEGFRDREWAEAFSFIAGLIDWNIHHANFCYYIDAFIPTNMPSSITGLIMVDLQSWYALATGDSNAMRQTFLYVTNGINDGERPAGIFEQWTGQYESRQWIALTTAVARGRAFTCPPPVSVFSATALTGRIEFNWQGMPGGQRYHLCWSTNTISLAHTLNTNYINWWAAETTLTNVVTAGGESLSLSVTSALPAGTPISACIFYFDSNRNMSVKTEILRPPTAGFAGGPRRGAAPLTVAFTNSSLGSYTSSRWLFGDGSVSNAEHPVHTYASAGDFTVTLTVSNAAGTGTLSRAGYVHVVPPGMPIADFNWDTNRGAAPLTVQFTNLSIGAIIANAWNFGDGATSALANPTHVFATAGTFTVTLIATTVSGADTCRVLNCIEALPPPPTADFAGQPTSGGYPLTVQFTNLTTGVATNWAWTFGDGGSSSARDPAHTYAVTGVFTVALTATGPGGADTRTRTDYITATPEPGQNYYIAAGDDDAYEYNTTMFIDINYTYLGYAPEMWSGYRFRNIQIPASSVVTKAYIQFYSLSGQSAASTVRIHGHKTAASSAFAPAVSNISARALTTASVAWDIPPWEYREWGDNERTPNLAPLINEIRSETAWTNGGSLAFLVAWAAGDGMRHPVTYEGAPAEGGLDRAPRLHIEYQTNVNFAAFNLRATALTNSVFLRWTAPALCGAPGWWVHIRAGTNTYPRETTAGVAVVTATNTWYHETGLPNDQPRFYTLWLSPDGTNWLSP